MSLYRCVLSVVVGAGVAHVSRVHIGGRALQPGITWNDLNEYLAEAGTGMFFPVDPGPGASIGGMCATGCSGTNAVRYGTMKANVLNVTVVLADGSVVRTAQRARKTSVG